MLLTVVCMFMYQGFVSRGAEGVASVTPMSDRATSRQLQNSHWPELSPLSFVGNTSVIMCLRKVQKCCTAVVRDEWGNVRKTVLQTPRSVKKEGEDVPQALNHRFPCSPWKRLWCCMLSPHKRRGMCPEGSCGPWKPYSGANSWQKLWPVGGDPCRKRFFWQDLWSNLFPKDCSLWKGSTLEKFLKDCIL